MSDRTKREWPVDGMTAFPSGVSREEPCFNQQIFRSSDYHSAAFFDLAELAIDKCLKDGDRPQNDVFLIPVLYLYRHSFELLLKKIVLAGKLLADHIPELRCLKSNGTTKALSSHSLQKLWNRARQVIKIRFDGHGDEPILAMDVLIRELNTADPFGQSFRYARDTRDDLNKREGVPESVSISGLRFSMSSINMFLISTCGGIVEWCEDVVGYRDTRLH